MTSLSKPGSKPRAACPEEVAFLELLRTSDQLNRRLVPVLKAEELSGTQYNVLRILRGAPEGLPCGEIGNRQLTLAYGTSGTQNVNDTVLNWRNVAPCGN